MPQVMRSPGQYCKKGSRWDRKQQYWLRRWHPSLSAWARASFSFCLNMFQCSFEKENYSFRLIFFQSVIFASSNNYTEFGWILLYPTDHKWRLGWLTNCNLRTHTFSKWYKCTFSFWIPISIHLICRARSFSYLFLPHVQTELNGKLQCISLDTAGWLLLLQSHGSVLKFPSNCILLKNFTICSKWICYSLPSSAVG